MKNWTLKNHEKIKPYPKNIRILGREKPAKKPKKERGVLSKNPTSAKWEYTQPASISPQPVKQVKKSKAWVDSGQIHESSKLRFKMP